MTMRTFSTRSVRGFSLIEVLIAVVVLSVGLLALAALQSALIRGAAESKAQSTALSLGEQKLEELRAFPSAAAFTALNSGVDTLNDAAGSRGGTNFNRTWTISRYVLNAATNHYVAVGTTLSDDAITTLNASYNPKIGFKRILVAVGWTDAAGLSQSIAIGDIISSIDPAASGNVLESIAQERRNPEVRIYNPANQIGVIPIAVGQDSSGRDQSVASSDPKPVQQGSTGRVSTLFNVQTYFQDSAGFVVQKSIETGVVSCSCQTTVNSGDTTPVEGPFTPSYWDGDIFTVPKPIASKPRGYLNSGVDQNAILCGLCCRDHHDSNIDPDPTDEISGADLPRFDPFRPATDLSAGDHNHYRKVARTRTATSASDFASGTIYDESCRLVRVDGIFRPTTDPRLENLSLLNMARSGTAVSLPMATISAYRDFATYYVNQLSSAVIGGTAQQALPDFTSTAPPLAQTDPVTLVRDQVFNLHGRGLFIDWVSREAKDKLRCIGNTTDPICQQELAPYRTKSVLQLFPFLTINVTNIGEWDRTLNAPTVSTATPVITFRNDAIPTIINTAFVRGEVTARNAGNARLEALSFRGASGLTDQIPIDPDDGGIDVTSRAPPFREDRDFEVLSNTDQRLTSFFVDIDARLATTMQAGNLNVVVNGVPCERSTNPTTRHTCYVRNSDVSISMTLSNYNRVTVTCQRAGNPSAIDPQDPATNCVRSSGTVEPPASVAVFDYGLCAVNDPRRDVTGLTILGFTETRPESNHPATDQTTVAMSIINAINLQGQVLQPQFHVELQPGTPSSTACP